MATEGKLADRLLNALRRKSKDRFMSRRYVLHIAREKMKFFLAQKLSDMTLYREENIFTDIPCLEMEQIRSVDCPIVEFKRCSIIMKSKEKLPELIFSRYGDSIRLVSNVDDSEKIDRTTPLKYINDRKRKPNNNKPYYYVREDGHLYIVDRYIEVVNVQPLTLDRMGAKKASCEKCDECISPLDMEFVGSDKLQELVVQETLKELLGSYMQIPTDNNPNNNENT
jgi:hypothetical protein